MSDPENGSSRRAFIGLAAMILGGLLFAAGVMVGRRTCIEEGSGSQDALSRIDQRDREPPTSVDPSRLQFPSVLTEPDSAHPRATAVETHRPEPAPIPKAVLDPRPPESRDAGAAPNPEPSQSPAPTPERVTGQPRDGGPGGEARDGGAQPGSPARPVRFAVQVGSFRDRSQAQGLIDKLAERGFAGLRIVEGSVGDSVTYFRVRVGNFRQRAEAEEMVRKLNHGGKTKALIVIEE